MLQRDLAAYGFRPNALFLRRLLTMLAAQQGGLLNLSALGNSLGVSYHTVEHGLDLLEGVFLVRRLAPYFCNIRKRLVKSPRVFIRDSGLLHHLLDIATSEDLYNHPLRGASWEGFVIEDLIRRERFAHPFTQFLFGRNVTGQKADLVLERGSQRGLASCAERRMDVLTTGIKAGSGKGYGNLVKIRGGLAQRDKAPR